MKHDHSNNEPRYPHINPPRRKRSDPLQTRLVNTPTAARPRAVDKLNALPDEQPQPRKPGYKNPPIEHRFKKGNPGGPGRPKGCKSQDTLLREMLAAKQSIRVGGRNRKVAKRELVATMFVNGALEKRDHKQLAALHAEARRLFPDQAPGTESAEVFNPAADREILRDLMAALRNGEPDDAAGDPLSDFAIAVFAAGEDEDVDQSWIRDEGDALDGEQSDDQS